ncbi:MAG: TolC family protein [Bacteroidetes bacterium]|nr:TolC family protein [Bacteroidota bacterium]
MNTREYRIMNKRITNAEVLFANPLRSLRFILLALIMVLPASLIGQSIEDYQQIAAENNPEVRSAFHQYLASLEEPDQMGALPDPEVAFAYFISPIETRLGPQQARISLTQMFPWFGTLGDKREIASIQSKAHFEIFRETRNRIFYQTEKAFLELYELDRSIEIAEENLQILNSLVEISLRRYETNQATQVDVLRAQIEQEDLKTQLALLRDNRSVLEKRISELLNHPENAQIHAPDTLNTELLLGDSQSLRNQLIRENPALSRLRYQEESSREMKKLAAKDGKPSFGIGADYIFTGERTDMSGLTDNGKDALIARASFRIPLFRNKYNSKVQQAEQNIQSAQMEISSKENSLETDLDESLRDYYDSERRFELYDQTQIQRVNQALTIMMQSYSTDSSNFEEILRMQRKLLDYQLSRIQSLADMHKTMAYIEYLTGQNNINPNEI